MCTYVSFFPRYFSFPFCRFSIFVFLLFSFIISYLSRKWRPTLFVLELRHLFLWSSGHSVKKIAKLFKKVWTISEHVVKSKDFGRQTKEWMSALLFFFKMGEKCSWKVISTRHCVIIRQHRKVKNFNFIISKWRPQWYGDMWPTKVGKPWREKGGATHADMVSEGFATSWETIIRQTHATWTPYHLYYRWQDSIRSLSPLLH